MISQQQVIEGIKNAIYNHHFYLAIAHYIEDSTSPDITIILQDNFETKLQYYNDNVEDNIIAINSGFDAGYLINELLKDTIQNVTIEEADLFEKLECNKYSKKELKTINDQMYAAKNIDRTKPYFTTLEIIKENDEKFNLEKGK